MTAASTTAWRGDAYVQLDKHLVPIERSIFSAEGYSYEGVAYHDGTKYQKLASDDLDEKAFEAAIAGGWIANLQHYFLVAALPVPSAAGGAETRPRGFAARSSPPARPGLESSWTTPR